MTSGPGAIVREATPADREAWMTMRRALWPGTDAEHRDEIARYFGPDGNFPREPWMVLLAFEGETPVGMAELSIRPYAEGCDTRRVAYLEGWFVAPAARRGGVGRALVLAAEEWGRRQGCTEFASDAEPDNEVSRRAHAAVGFEEVGLVRCFRKQIGRGGQSG